MFWAEHANLNSHCSIRCGVRAAKSRYDVHGPFVRRATTQKPCWSKECTKHSASPLALSSAPLGLQQNRGLLINLCLRPVHSIVLGVENIVQGVPHSR
jgi:hypothetical protein